MIYYIIVILFIERNIEKYKTQNTKHKTQNTKQQNTKHKTQNTKQQNNKKNEFKGFQ
jgi:hypothetical protein